MLKFLHWLTTSRYTLCLEQQLADLKREKEALNQRIRELESAMIPALRVIEKEKIPPAEIVAKNAKFSDNKEPKQYNGVKIEVMPPRAVNWMQTRDRLEYASDEKGARFERAEKAHANL